MLLAVFAGLFGTATVEVAGAHVPANRASVPGIMGLAVLTGSFMALVMTVVTQREDGILKRRRATPVPGGARRLARVAATLSSVAACAILVVVAGAAFGIDPPPGGLLPALLVVVAGSICFACCGYAVAALVTTPGLGPADAAGRDAAAAAHLRHLLPDVAAAGWLQRVADAFPLAHLTNALQHAWLPSGGEIAWGDLGVALWAVAAGWVAARTLQVAAEAELSAPRASRRRDPAAAAEVAAPAQLVADRSTACAPPKKRSNLERTSVRSSRPDSSTPGSR